MTEINIFSAFFIGVAGGVHCVGMCGGIVAALRSVIPSNTPSFPYTLSYNFGRILSYTLAGAITGGVGQVATQYIPVAKPTLSIISAVMLLLLASYLGKWWQGLIYIESLGKGLFKLIQPFSKRFLPFKNPLYAVPYGFIWGWLPCGLVYSTLTWSLASGSALDGALIMLFFGLGTLPTLLAVSLGSQYIVDGFRHPLVRQFICSIMAMYAIFLIYRAFS